MSRFQTDFMALLKLHPKALLLKLHGCGLHGSHIFLGREDLAFQFYCSLTVYLSPLSINQSVYHSHADNLFYFFSHPHSGPWAIAGINFWKSWGEVIGCMPNCFWKNRAENMQNSWKKDKQMQLENMVLFLCQQISARAAKKPTQR